MILRTADLTLFHEQWSASVGRVDPLPGSWPPMPLGDSQITRCVLRPQLDSAAAAGEFTHKTLAGWGIGDLAGVATEVVCALVANVVHHKRPTTTPAPGRNGRIQLVLLHSGHRLTAIVTDSGAELPIPPQPEALADGGRGLHLVRALSTTWGWARLATGGKAVWAVINHPGPCPAPTPAVEEPAAHKATAGH